MSAEDNMITTKMNLLIIALQKSIQLTIASIMKQSFNTIIPSIDLIPIHTVRV